ncbi:MAG TPA: hypothetical protein VMS17_08870, partial [Gemmataceae bacterium]|nr:hypothetical protein [Gemmataceae bacterium]
AIPADVRAPGRQPAQVRPANRQVVPPAARQIVQTFVDDVNRTEAVLAEVKDPDVKLPLHVALIRIDPFGQGKPVSAAFVFGRLVGCPDGMGKKAGSFFIGFDRGDVSWLRAYCHLLAALGELLLAVDGQEAFDCGAPLLFEKVETPHTFLLENRRGIDEVGFAWDDRAYWSDVVSLVHNLIRLPIKEPARTKAALAHLEAAVAQAKEMWKYILAETDDDNEWIPNPRQTGVLGVKVTQEMVDVWLETLDEADDLLKGKKLLPFWRGKDPERGVNLRRVFTEPRTFDAIEWVQGTAATPYLEKGPLTKLAGPRMGDRLNKAFGGPNNIIGFGFWFN